MRELISQYLEDKESAWALSTWKSEKARLNSIADQLDKTPAQLHSWCKAQGLKSYTIKTLFIRLTDFEKWAEADWGYQKYMKTHRNRFKHAYQKEEIKITYEAAVAHISNLRNNSPASSHALGLIQTGLRLNESYGLAGDAVRGKGGKTRKIFGRIEATVSKSTLARRLKEIGLKPHTLRKLCATRLADRGATAADLCKVFGWSSISTAYQYLQAKDDEKLAALMETKAERS